MRAASAGAAGGHRGLAQRRHFSTSKTQRAEELSAALRLDPKFLDVRAFDNKIIRQRADGNPGASSRSRPRTTSTAIITLGSVALPHPAGSPRFLDCSFPARCPHPPRKVRRVLAHCFPADNRLHQLWQTGHLHWCHEAESGSLALRLAGLRRRFPPDRLLRPAPVPLHVRMSNLHGELLSVH